MWKQLATSFDEAEAVEQLRAIATCTWLAEIVGTTADERLLSLLWLHSDPATWQRQYDWINKIQTCRERQTYDRESYRPALRKWQAGLALDSAEQSELDYYWQCEVEIAIYMADVGCMVRRQLAIQHGLRSRHVELIERFPVVNCSMARPSDAEFREFAERCQFIHACLLAKLVAEPSLTTNGPVSPNGFRWNDIVHYGLTPIPWRLLNHCWRAENHCASFDNLASVVWNDHEHEFAGGPLKAAASKIRSFFKNNEIPLDITVYERSKTVTIFQKI